MSEREIETMDTAVSVTGVTSVSESLDQNRDHLEPGEGGGWCLFVCLSGGGGGGGGNRG